MNAFDRYCYAQRLFPRAPLHRRSPRARAPRQRGRRHRPGRGPAAPRPCLLSVRTARQGRGSRPPAHRGRPHRHVCGAPARSHPPAPRPPQRGRDVAEAPRRDGLRHLERRGVSRCLTRGDRHGRPARAYRRCVRHRATRLSEPRSWPRQLSHHRPGHHPPSRRRRHSCVRAAYRAWRRTPTAPPRA